MNQPIDIVYTWVNGRDPNWISKRQKYFPDFKPSCTENGSARFEDNDELKYSLRSVAKYVDWVNHIYIVTDEQAPIWLNLEHPKITIVDHKDIFDSPNHLPCYNSAAIEWRVAHINGLSEQFLYLNDDFFFGHSVSPGHFFKEGQAILKAERIYKNMEVLKSGEYIKKKNPYQNAIFNSRVNVLKKLDVLAPYAPYHGVYAMNKSDIFKLEDNYSALIENTLESRTRNNDDVFIYALYLFDAYARGREVRKINRLRRTKMYYKLTNSFKRDDFYLYLALDAKKKKLERHLALLKTFEPYVFCLNDTQEATEENRNLVRNFLDEKFSTRSEYELNGESC